MTEQTPQSLGAGLFYEDVLRLRWRVVEESPEARQPQLQETNEEFLRLMSALEEHTPDLEDDATGLAQEILRLDSKVTLLLNMVGKMLASQLVLPEPLPVRIGARSVEWVSALTVPVGSHVHVEVYLRPDYPFPLVLPGEVAAVAREAGGTRVAVTLGDLGKSVQDWLEKTIFRHHRRLVAHARRTGAPDAGH